MIVLTVLLFLIGIVLLWGVVIYNQLVKLKNMVGEGWSGIDVQLKKRANLIPNLVEAVKGYMGHEKALLEKVTELRSRSMQATDPAQKGPLEGAIGRSLANILAVAEQYPELKADKNFRDLQKQLSQIESDIEMARRYYNGTVRNLNIRVESFPGNIIAGRFNFRRAEFFEIEDQRDRQPPQVQF
ncbi:MAG: LemA family protein [Deltaproteobacteria bacterium]|nr:MAG: LemA family protein [Deltaproteobacteria bacterium]